MRKKVKVISVATSITATALANQINNQLTQGWEFKFMIVASSNWMIIFEKTVSA